MLEGFSSALSQLRRESGLNQRRASAELGISQALLSHYENGIREPGLEFVVRTCEYYGVSADFILGRTSVRDGAACASGGESGDEPALCKHRLCNSLGVAFDHIGRFGSQRALEALSRLLYIQCYKVLRLIPSAPVKKPDKKLWLAAASEALAEASAMEELAQEASTLEPIELEADFPERCGDVMAVIEASEKYISSK